MGDRQNFTDRTKRLAWERSKGICESCGKTIRPGDGPEYDHDKLAFYGGDNSLANCRVLCRPCHSLKTIAHNSYEVPKSRRLIKKGAGLRGKALRGRPLPGTKASGLRKKMNGDVEKW
jgi:5-methylcytosine-specific restriction endonuclease McrA